MNDRGKYVAKIITATELVLNVGKDDGVRKGDCFGVVDMRTRDIRDPKTGENLGSIDRFKVELVVTDTAPRLAIARRRETGFLGITFSEAVTGTSLAGGPFSGGDEWPEGVRVGDPVVPIARPKDRPAE